MLPLITASTFSVYLIILLTIVIVLFLLNKYIREKSSKNSWCAEPPSPMSLPIIGHLHLLGGYEVPYQAFTDLGKKYGEIVKLKLGNVNSIVVNGQDNIREVLGSKNSYFDGRPNFERYGQLFGGSRSNSLAFCDWSEAQKARRDILTKYTFPRMHSNKFTNLEEIIGQETSKMVSLVEEGCSEIKPLILNACASIFINYFCSKSFSYDDAEFVEMIDNFDEIFYEINQGYAADFMPFLLPLHRGRIGKMRKSAHKIRDFIEKKVIGNRYDNFGTGEPTDFVESLIHYVKNEETPLVNWDVALYALEDIIGGHSAVGNFFTKLLAYIVQDEEVQKKIQQEIDANVQQGIEISISNKSSMPYTDATIFEAIRLISSPIVPRVANQDTMLKGYLIKKDTLMFLNNYELSMSEELWNEPKLFKPERFILNGHVLKPEHFLPFGGGKRGCMGYRMVQLISFGLLTSLLKSYTILPVETETYKVPIGALALPKNTFKFKFVRRKSGVGN